MSHEPQNDLTNAMEEVAPVPEPDDAATAPPSLFGDHGAEPPPVIDHFGEPWWELVPIPIHDNGEPLVDVFQVEPSLKWLYDSPRFDFPRFGLIRESAAFMLRRAQALLPSGLSLIIVGAFRPFATQKAMYEIAWREFKDKHPTWPDEAVTEYVNVFSAPPIQETPPPHSTGGAVDLSIVDDSGERIDMTSPFEMGWDSAPTQIEGLSEVARQNRQLLIDVLSEAGLTNFRGEWWHWSYGEPGWALRGNHPAALYGAVPDDQIPSWEPPPRG